MAGSGFSSEVRRNVPPRYHKGLRFQFWAKESCKYSLLWTVLLLSITSAVMKLWDGGGVWTDHNRTVRDLSGTSNRSSRFTVDDTGEHSNCTVPSIYNFPRGLMNPYQERHGGVLVNIAVMLYMFVALAIVCDDYFMPALENICNDLNLREDVAGATFMSMGGSAPELFASVIGVFIAKGDIGVGTIVGSAVFNLLFVVGLCGILAGKEILLTCWPLVRDSTCYLITIGALVLAVSDEIIHWYDATMLLLLYIGYLVLMYFNENLERSVTRWMNDNVRCEYKKSYDLERTLAVRSAEGETLLNGHTFDDDGEEYELYQRKQTELDEKTDLMNGHGPTTNNKSVDNKYSGTDSGDSSPFDVPDTCLKIVPWLLSLPIGIIFYLTIPDCRKERWKRYYALTFIIALVWIGILTFVLVWMVTIIGFVLGIHDTIMGLTLLAAGASTPDTILSIIAAREGYGDMAISHSIGSNLFDILVGLGCPWFLQTVVVGFNSSVSIYSGAVTYISMLLLLNVVALVAAVTFLKFKLNCKLGVVLLLLYFVFLVASLLFEMNLIIPDLSLPVCEI